MTIHCLITKIFELGACFSYFSYALAQDGRGGVTSHPFHPPGSALRKMILKMFFTKLSSLVDVPRCVAIAQYRLFLPFSL